VDASVEDGCNSLYETYPMGSYEILDLFSYDWYGVRALAYWPSKKFVGYGYNCSGKNCRRPRKLSPFPQVQATIFGGKRICGVRYWEGRFEKTL